MEQGRVFLAIVLSLMVFLIWDFFFVDKEAIRQQAPQQAQEQAVQPSDQKNAPVQQSAPVATAPAQNPPANQAAPAAQTMANNNAPSRTIKVDTPLYIAEVSEQGGNLTGFILKEYRETVEADSPFKQLISEENTFGTVRLSLSDVKDAAIETGKYQSDAASDHVKILDASQTLSFHHQMPNGMRIIKSYTFAADTYLVDLSVTIENQGTMPLSQRPGIALVKHEANDQSGYGFTGPSGYINDQLKQVKKKKIADQNVFPGTINWIGIQDRYFFTGIMPKNIENHTMRLAIEDNNFIRNQLISPAITLNPGSRQTTVYSLFFGPKSLKILKQYGNNLNKAVDFGFFDILAKPCLWVMNFIHDNLIANYGVAIILLTLLTKIILWPLGQKSYKSMAEMKKLQPLMAEIREKYKHDKKKMNEEVMGLYRAYKVNPMGGCLPMVVQIPVFFALYRMLYEAIELRHAPFFGWINDLSAPDRLFDFGFAIPLMQPPYGIPVLTLVMGGTMFLQQKLQPAMGDPTQAKLMMLMPIFFTFIFINFSSGLVLYWLINNVFSIGQQYITQGRSK